MIVYPQLATGALVQYPFRKTYLRRTIVNSRLDGTLEKLADSGAAYVRWTLAYRGLTDTEWEQLDQLFHYAEGRLRTFVFLDPFDNLLKFSDDLSQGTWSRDPNIDVGSTTTDPLGGAAAQSVSNQSAVIGRVHQTVSAPGSLRYCFSFFMRSVGRTAVTGYISAGSETQVTEAFADERWQRLECSFQMSSDSDTVQFGLELNPNTSIEVFGFQA